MISERLLLEKWRALNDERRCEVLNFIEFIASKSSSAEFIPESDRAESRNTAEKVRDWLDWAKDNPKPSPNLPDEAMHRDRMYGTTRTIIH
jgi:hypothetical protein